MEASPKGHSYFHGGLIFAAVIVFIFMVNFSGFAAHGIGVFMSSGLFNLLEKYTTHVTPIGFTFTALAITYAWQLVWLLYAVITIFRDGVGGPLYRNPALLPPIFFIVFIANLGFNISWLFVWDREMLVAAVVLLLFVVVTLIFCIAISMIHLTRNLEVLSKNCLGGEKWWIWIGVQNGLADYATWATIAASFGLAIALEYVGGVSRLDAGTAGLVIIIFLFVAWSLLEITLLDKYARYLIIHYFTVTWALIGIIIHRQRGSDWSPTDRNVIITAIGICIAILLTSVKFIVLCYRDAIRPRFWIQ